MGLIKKPVEIESKRTLSLLIYGEPGIGKTTLGCSAPNAVLFDYDNGVHRINIAHRVDTLQVHSWEETGQALDEIAVSMPEVQSIIIDTAGKMLDFMTASIIRTDPKMAMRDGSLSLKGYGVRKTMFINFLKRLQTMGKNVIFIAHEREEKRGEETVKRPEIGGSSANDLLKELDLVGYMRAIGKKRTITFDPEEHYYAKNTCNLPANIDIPMVLDDKGNSLAPNAFLGGILDRFIKTQDAAKVATEEYNKLITSIQAESEKITDAATANAFVEYVGKVKHLFDSKIVSRRFLTVKVNELGLTFNATTRSYELKTA